MRIALLILTPAFSIPMVSVLFGLGGLVALVGTDAPASARNTLLAGLVLLLGWLFGMAFVMRYPWASVVFYGLAGVLALILAMNSVVIIFAVVSFAFAALAYAGGNELKRDLYEVEARHDELLEAIAALAPQPPPRAIEPGVAAAPDA